MKRFCAILCLLLLAGCLAQRSRDVQQDFERLPRGIILFVGDGMGVATITAARIHAGFLEGRAAPVTATLAIDQAPMVSLVRTYSADQIVTDSAAAITAMLSGHKVPNGAVCCIPNGAATDTLRTVFTLAEEMGLATGVVTTTRITHATPAGAYAHVLDRDDELAIATHLFPNENPLLGDGLEVILGGGRSYFLPEAQGGRRTDGRDLLSELTAAGYTLADHRQGLSTAATTASRVCGLYGSSHMAYSIDRLEEAPDQPSLAEMVDAALEVLSRYPRFLLLVEGGRIDHALHETNGRRAVTEMLEFDRAVAVALARGTKETLILVTSDHDHTMVVAGYPPADQDVFSIAGVDLNDVPYTTLLFANGRVEEKPPRTLAPESLANHDFTERAGVPLESDTHGGMDVPLYAWDDLGVLGSIPASVDNTHIHDLIVTAIRGRTELHRARAKH